MHSVTSNPNKAERQFSSRIMFLGLLFASDLVNCPQDTGKIVTGLRCVNGCKSAKLRCTDATLSGLSVARTGNVGWTSSGSRSAISCKGNTVATSLETLDSGTIRMTCSRLERFPNSNVVPEISFVACIVLGINDKEMSRCPNGYGVNGLVTTGKHIVGFQCCLIKSPTTIGPVAPIKGMASVPLGGIVPSATVLNGQIIGQAPVVASPQNIQNTMPNAIPDQSQPQFMGTNQFAPSTPNADQINSQFQQLQSDGAFTQVQPSMNSFQDNGMFPAAP